MKRIFSILLLGIIALQGLCFNRDYAPLYYKDKSGKEQSLQRWYIDLTGQTESLQFTLSKDRDKQRPDRYSQYQYVYLYEKKDGNYLYLRLYEMESPYSGGSAEYKTKGNIWVKVTPDWQWFIDSDGKKYRLYKK